jgi:hypothetical protein
LGDFSACVPAAAALACYVHFLQGQHICICLLQLLDDLAASNTQYEQQV